MSVTKAPRLKVEPPGRCFSAKKNENLLLFQFISGKNFFFRTKLVFLPDEDEVRDQYYKTFLSFKDHSHKQCGSVGGSNQGILKGKVSL